MKDNVLIYIAVMAVTTYFIRMLPFTVFSKKIKNIFFKSFLTYVPYAVIAAMTIPSILNSTNSIWSAAAGLATAVILAFLEKNLIVVAISSCIAVFVVELFL